MVNLFLISIVLLVVFIVVGILVFGCRRSRNAGVASSVTSSTRVTETCGEVAVTSRSCVTERPCVIGRRGKTGPRGDSGCRGPCGPSGDKGNQGDRGRPGCPGPKGAAGERGQVGQVGNQGPQGFDGVTGIQGNQGPQGPLGLRGPSGIVGLQGPQGALGTQGRSGANFATRFWVFSTPGVVALTPGARDRFIYSVSFSEVGLARVVDPLTTTFDQFYPDLSWSLPHSVVLRSLTITLSGRVGNTPAGGTGNDVIATVPTIIQGLTFGVYAALPEEAEFKLTSLAVHFVSDDVDDNVRVEQSGLVSLFFPVGTQLSLCMFNGVDLINPMGQEPMSNYSLDLKIAGALRYDCVD